MGIDTRILKTYSITPTIDTSAYASGDQLGSLMTIPNALLNFGAGTLENITIIDKDKQNAALNILFFSAAPTITSVDNAALDISDTEMVSKCLGYVPIAAADYKSLNVNSVATIAQTVAKPNLIATSDSLYAIILSGGTPTYTSTSGLVVKFSIRVG